MGNVEINQAIRAVAPLLSRCAAGLRKSEAARKLARLILRGRVTDHDDRKALAYLITGKLNTGRGQHGVAYNRLNEAARAARAYAKAKGVSLDKAAEAVADEYKLVSKTLKYRLWRTAGSRGWQLAEQLNAAAAEALEYANAKGIPIEEAAEDVADQYKLKLESLMCKLRRLGLLV